MKQNLSDPQSFNSYSYAEGNPIRLSDPLGLGINDFGGPSGTAIGSYRNINIYSNGGDPFNTPYQCTEFANRFITSQWNAGSISADGKDFTAPTMNAQSNNGYLQYVTSYNGQSRNSLPVEDSIIAFGPKSTDPYGHVAVIGAISYNEKTNSGYVVLAKQNPDPRVYE